MFPPDLIARAADLVARYKAAGLMAATAESCTGGLIAALLTEIPGSSSMLERGFVVYSNAAKQELLGVPTETLASHGAVSAETARAMAEGALRASRAEVAVSVTGIAGPDGGSTEKPVGLVHFACARRGKPTVAREERFGAIGREAVRLASVRVGLDLLDAAVRGA
jgi:nicotinamide-nucleotide amidase